MSKFDGLPIYKVYIEFMSLKIINKMQTDHTPAQDISICKNHPEIPSGYFLSDQPWIKYCKQCALNVALCGRKIEK